LNWCSPEADGLIFCRNPNTKRDNMPEDFSRCESFVNFAMSSSLVASCDSLHTKRVVTHCTRSELWLTAHEASCDSMHTKRVVTHCTRSGLWLTAHEAGCDSLHTKRVVTHCTRS